MENVKIERGILIADQETDILVKTVGGLYKLNISSMTDRTYSVNENIIGIILENKFCICHSLILTTGETYFGRILNNTFNSTSFRFQIIKDFSEIDYRSHRLLEKYNLGPEIILKKEQVKNFDDE
jgi:hypothetical protein